MLPFYAEDSKKNVTFSPRLKTITRTKIIKLKKNDENTTYNKDKEVRKNDGVLRQRQKK